MRDRYGEVRYDETNPRSTTIAEGGRRLAVGARVNPPLVSIITVVFNAAPELGSVVESVLALASPETEFIIIDGGSRDGTLELLRKWDLQVDYWVSGPDAGIYDAMNKGIAAAEGIYVLHLNAGDRLLCLPTECLRSCAQENVDVATFRVTIDGQEVFVPKVGLALKLSNTWHHQGTFYRRDVHPGYVSAYKIFGDMHVNQRLLKAGRSVKIFDTVVADHRNNGISNSGQGSHELYRSIQANFGSIYLVPAFFRFKYLGLCNRVRQILLSCRKRRTKRAKVALRTRDSDN